MTSLALLCALLAPAPEWRVVASGDHALVIDPTGKFALVPIHGEGEDPSPFEAFEVPERLNLVAPLREGQFVATTRSSTRPQFVFLYPDGVVGTGAPFPAGYSPVRLVACDDGTVFSVGTVDGKPASYVLRPGGWTDLGGKGVGDRGIDTGRSLVSVYVDPETFKEGRGFSVSYIDQENLDTAAGDKMAPTAFFILPNSTPKGATPEAALVSVAGRNSVGLLFAPEDKTAPFTLVVYGPRGVVTGWTEVDPGVIEPGTPLLRAAHRVSVASPRLAVAITADGTLHVAPLKDVRTFPAMDGSSG